MHLPELHDHQLKLLRDLLPVQSLQREVLLAAPLFRGLRKLLLKRSEGTQSD
jgi:hypothetical protein